MEDDDDFTDWLIAREECIMDLDEGEVNKDIEFIKELIEQNKIDIKGVSYGKQYSILRTIKIILAEREADKKRIKELKVENLRLKGRIDVTNWQEKTVYESLKEKYIPIQKVKDKIEEYKKQKDKYESEIQEVFKNNYYHGKILELTHKIWGLEEILEDK